MDYAIIREICEKSSEHKSEMTIAYCFDNTNIIIRCDRPMICSIYYYKMHRFSCKKSIYHSPNTLKPSQTPHFVHLVASNACLSEEYQPVTSIHGLNVNSNRPTYRRSELRTGSLARLVQSASRMPSPERYLMNKTKELRLIARSKKMDAVLDASNKKAVAKVIRKQKIQSHPLFMGTSRVKGKSIAQYHKMIAKCVDLEMECNVPYDIYMSLVSQPCHYCQYQLGSKSKSVGLDRLDSAKGYVLGNVVSCCRMCNVIKSDFLTEDETMAAVRAVIELRLTRSQCRVPHPQYPGGELLVAQKRL